MKGIKRRRVALVCAGLGTAAALAAFTFGATNALFTSQADSQSNSIVAGTMSLTQNAAQSVAVNVTGLMPGDPQNVSKYYLDYAGQPAFVGLDFTVTSTAAQPCSAYAAGAGSIDKNALVADCTGVGELPLFDGHTGSGDLDLSILPENGTTAHQLFNDVDIATKATCSAAVGGLVSCTASFPNVVLPHTYGVDLTSIQWLDGQHGWVTVKTSLPLAAGNQFQGSSVAISLTGHAVQVANNNSTVGAVAPACSPATTWPNGLGSQSTLACPISW